MSTIHRRLSEYYVNIRILLGDLMKKTLVFLLAASISIAYGQDLKWETSLEKALSRAKAEKKIVFVDVWAAWCGPCKRLQKEVFPTSQAQAALSHVIPLSLQTRADDNSETENVWAEKAYSIEAYPTMFFLDENGKQIGERHLGFMTPNDFSIWVTKVADKFKTSSTRSKTYKRS
jgi:thiol:disulfide interchange protein